MNHPKGWMNLLKGSTPSSVRLMKLTYQSDLEMKVGMTFEVFEASQYSDLKLEPGWYWDAPECREDCTTSPRGEGGRYLYVNGPFKTRSDAYRHATRNDGDLIN